MSDIHLNQVICDAYLYNPDEAERRWTGDTSTYFLARGETTGGQLSVIDGTAHYGEAVPLHRHFSDPESMYVLEGEVTLYLGGEYAKRAEPGAFAHFPAGTIQGFRITFRTARYLLITNAHHGSFHRAISCPSGPGGAKPEQHINEAHVMAACLEYNVEIIGDLPAAATYG